MVPLLHNTANAHGIRVGTLLPSPPLQKFPIKEFPGGLVVRIRHLHHSSQGSIPGLRIEIPYQKPLHVVAEIELSRPCYLEASVFKAFFFFFAALLAYGSSRAGDQTYTTIETTLDP